MTKPKVTYICSECHGNDVLVDAYAEWDEEAQEFVLQSTFDQAVCETCGGETTLEEVELTS